METKKWYESKGVNGSIVAIITTLSMLLLRAFGYDAETESASIGEIITIIMALIGSIIALIGRLKASKKVIL